MDLYVYDDFEMIAVVDKFTSFRWRRQYYDCGEFELHCDDNLENINLLTAGRQIVRSDRSDIGIIEGINLLDGEIKVTGRFLSCWLDFAIIDGLYQKDESYETSIRKWVTDYVIPEHSALELGNTLGDTNVIDFQTSYKNVLENTSKFCKACEMGFRIKKDMNAEKYYFDLYRGVNRSHVQSENDKVFFSDEFCNLSSPNYEYSNADYRNYIVVLGEGEGTAKIKVVIDNRASGESKRALYVDGSGQSVESGMSKSQYIALLTAYGNQKAGECKIIENFTGEAIATPKFVYLSDWDLGDVVTIESKRWNKAIDQRITEVEEIYENNTETITPVFGDPLPETIDLEDLI